MRVMIVEDSAVVRQLLRAIMESEGFQVIEAQDGQEALTLLHQVQPDVITMDVHMPGLDGYQTTERILESYGVPIIVVTASANVHATETAMQALAAGALAVIEKPTGPADPIFPVAAEELVRTIKRLAGVKVVPRQRPGRREVTEVDLGGWSKSVLMVAIGASAGGPMALKALVQGLHPECPWPFLLVQHIATGFLPSFRDWLDTISPLPVHIAHAREAPEPGHIYLAPDDHHLGLDDRGRFTVDAGERCEGVRPSATYLFRSLAKLPLAPHTIAIILSGMGKDGAEGMEQLKAQGALTLVQDPSTAIVDGMPQAAIQRNAASRVLAPEAMTRAINQLYAKQTKARESS